MNKTTTVIVALVLIVAGAYVVWERGTPQAQVPPDTESGDTTMENSATTTDDMMTTDDSMVSDNTSVQEFKITGVPFEFSVKEIRVKEGDTVRIVFTSDQGTHDWVVDEFNARTKQLTAGQTDTIEFVADTVGTFEYYCSVDSHRVKGMVGKLTVE